jgi:cell division protein FtsN
MPRDYKHHKRPDTSSRSGMGFVAGLTLGVTIALGVFIYDRRVAPPPAAAPPTQAQRPSPARPATPRPAKVVQPQTPQSRARTQAPQFDFYEMLPKFEVVIPEQDESAPAQARGTPLQKAGVYMLQAGSFRNSADAERVRALIALQGVQSKIQRVAIDRDTWHRVRIGPITDLKRLEDTRGKLREAQIETLVIRVGG